MGGDRVYDIEKKFNKDMLNIYTCAKKELNYNATRFLQLISEKGGVEQQNN